MTDATPPVDHGPREFGDPGLEVAHEGPIRTPKQLLLAVVWAHIVPVAAIVLLAVYVAAHFRPAAGSDALQAASVAKRIQPVGHVEVRDASDPTSMKNGEQVYAAQCSACHAAGVAGSPKFGDNGAWAPRIAQGYDTLLQSALRGKGAMGPQGGGDFSDLEIGRAVVYMANKSGGSLQEPAATPLASAAASPPPAAQAGGDAAAAAVVATAKAAMANVGTVKTAAATTTPATTQAAGAGGAVPAVYTQACQVCHAQGIAGAPKFGDKTAWAPRLAQGIDVLTTSVLKGKGAMPPKGGSTASDAEIRAAVTYMANNSK